MPSVGSTSPNESVRSWVLKFGRVIDRGLRRRRPRHESSRITVARLRHFQPTTCRSVREARPTRPEGVVTAALVVEGDAARLIAFWRDRETLDAYLAGVDVPRGVELMRKVGCEPEWRIVETLELG